MHRKLFPLAAVLLSFAGLANSASADVLFSSRGNGVVLDSLAIFTYLPDPLSSPQTPSSTLEDATMVGSGPFSIQSLRLGYYNESASVTSVLARVTFYDTVNYGVPDASPVASSQIGSPYTFAFTATPGIVGPEPYVWNETGVLTLPGALAMPDSTFGIKLEYLNPNTLVPLTNVYPIFHEVPMVGGVGTSDEAFAADFNGNGVIVGLEIRTWRNDDNGYPAATMYMELNGTVPEPASLSLLALGGVVGLRRRRV